jgi:hypothetical protein
MEFKFNNNVFLRLLAIIGVPLSVYMAITSFSSVPSVQTLKQLLFKYLNTMYKTGV